MPKASWLPVAFVHGQLAFCLAWPALPCPALGLYVPDPRLGPDDITAPSLTLPLRNSNLPYLFPPLLGLFSPWLLEVGPF